MSKLKEAKIKQELGHVKPYDAARAAGLDRSHDQRLVKASFCSTCNQRLMKVIFCSTCDAALEGELLLISRTTVFQPQPAATNDILCRLSRLAAQYFFASSSTQVT